MTERKPPYVMNSDTSQAAGASMRPHTPRLREQILEMFEFKCHGWTCDELELELGLSHQTCSPRVHELAESGEIVDSGERRKTRTGRRATVWRRRPDAQSEETSRAGD